jgi:diadenosine tetraphosphate (Ap4A) HIT family hydrolase
VVLQSDGAYAVYDRNPVSRGHLLVIPRRHVASLFEVTPDEIRELFRLLRRSRDYLEDAYGPDGYNVGVNCGPAAGQTVMHVHVHLIPRYQGDVSDPTGGVRGAIPSKQFYPH